jgi:hypothetical protein
MYIPAGDLIGGSARGWTVAKSVLGFERIHVGTRRCRSRAWRCSSPGGPSPGVLDDPAVCDRIAALRLDVDHLAAAYTGFARVLESGAPLGPDVSLLKLWATETFQRIADLVIEVAGSAGGAAGAVHIGGDEIRVLGAYYRARPSTIYGGSSEVQRNISPNRCSSCRRNSEMVDGAGNSAMLAGVQVLDLATLAAAPLAATYLGEFGADVIKVEQPAGGDPIRTWGNQRDGVGLMWKSVSRNKRSGRSTCVSPKGEAAAGWSSMAMVVANTPAPRHCKVGLDYAACAPSAKIVMLHITGYSLTGEEQAARLRVKRHGGLDR